MTAAGVPVRVAAVRIAAVRIAAVVPSLAPATAADAADAAVFVLGEVPLDRRDEVLLQPLVIEPRNKQAR